MRRAGEELLLTGSGNWYRPAVATLASETPDAVLTVAHGDLFPVAHRYAEQIRRPLVTIFHDWWPDMVEVGSRVRESLERAFRDLYAKSDLALCVSPGMLAELGPHPNAHVLYPIPADLVGPCRVTPVETVTARDKLKVIYAGNLHEYGPMLQSLLERLDGHPTIQLQVRGNRPAWPTDFQERMRAGGNWLPFVPREQIQQWLTEADAFLIPQVFNDARRRLMRTNFPSKIPEMAQFRKPLVLWAPTEASGTVWQRETQATLCISDPEPMAVINGLEELAGSSGLRTKLSDAADRVACTMFAPHVIQTRFLELLRQTIQPKD
jgi:glycosyltransferase involved in cell wall biosynthesis